jgi:hypothetical protein
VAAVLDAYTAPLTSFDHTLYLYWEYALPL